METPPSPLYLDADGQILGRGARGAVTAEPVSLSQRALHDEHGETLNTHAWQHIRVPHTERALVDRLPEDGADSVATARVSHADRARLTPGEHEAATTHKLVERGDCDPATADRIGVPAQTAMRLRHQAGPLAGGSTPRAVQSAWNWRPTTPTTASTSVSARDGLPITRGLGRNDSGLLSLRERRPMV